MGKETKQTKKIKKQTKQMSVYEVKVKPRLDEVYEWRAGGATLGQIASKLGVSLTGLINMRSREPDLLTVLDAGKKLQIDSMVGSLYALATGQARQVETITKTVSGPQGTTIETTTKEIQLPPDRSAAINLLANLSMWQRGVDDGIWHDSPDSYQVQKMALELKRELESF